MAMVVSKTTDLFNFAKKKTEYKNRLKHNIFSICFDFRWWHFSFWKIKMWNSCQPLKFSIKAHFNINLVHRIELKKKNYYNKVRCWIFAAKIANFWRIWRMCMARCSIKNWRQTLLSLRTRIASQISCK